MTSAVAVTDRPLKIQNGVIWLTLPCERLVCKTAWRELWEALALFRRARMTASCMAARSFPPTLFRSACSLSVTMAVTISPTCAD
jgi:hypothetical protein